MKHFLKEILFFKPEDWLEWMVIILAWLTTLFVSSIIIWLLYLGVNYTGVNKKEGTGIIVAKTHSNSYITTTYINSGKILVPITQYHPESWGLDIMVTDKTDVVSVSEETHNSTKIGTNVWVTYKRGRLDNQISISDFKFITP